METKKQKRQYTVPFRSSETTSCSFAHTIKNFNSNPIEANAHVEGHQSMVRNSESP